MKLATVLTLVMLAAAIGDSDNAFGQEPGLICPSGALLAQPPNLGSEGWDAYVSDSAAGYFRYETLRGMPEPVCGIRWWGLAAADSGAGLVECDDTPASFGITFYGDDQDRPGATVCSYAIDVAGTAVAVVNGWTLYEYEVSLDSCCVLTDGWVSIAGANGVPSCWFLWNSSPVGDDSACQRNPVNDLVCASGQHFRDLSLCLTGYPVPVEPSTWGAIKARYGDLFLRLR